MTITVDPDRCNGCGVCGDICPRRIPETVVDGSAPATVVSPERSSLCMDCGHCSAVCPQNAIQMETSERDQLRPIKKIAMSPERLLYFLRQRRSVRRYKQKPVSRDLIRQIIDAVHCSPTGTGARTTGMIVIDSPGTLDRLSELVYDMYAALEKNLSNPLARFLIKRQAGEKKLRTLQDFVMPGMHWYIRWYREGKSNEILRDCPVLMLFHSPVFEPVAAENCFIAAFHAILMAETLGLGSCFNDLIPPACQRVPEIGKLLGLAEDREVYAGITMGHPRYKFKRIPARKLADISFL